MELKSTTCPCRRMARWCRDDGWWCMQGNGTVLANPVHSNLWEYRAPLILQMAAVGRECFDCPYYRNTNEDIASMSCWELWTHFVNFGQFEVRPVRCALTPHTSCPPGLAAVVETY